MLKKLKIVLGVLAIGAMSFSPNLLNATCEVSADESKNTGHCRIEPGGTAEICYSTGEGPACSGTDVGPGGGSNQ